MRINLFGGPGAGKSTTAAIVFARMKMAGLSVEHVSEYVKAWAYQNRSVGEFDQVYLMGKQQQYEYRFLSRGVNNIVTDSPVFLSYVYAKKHVPQLGIHEPILEICKAYETKFPSLNILLDRGDKPYDPAGRWQTHDEAKEIDELIERHLRWGGMRYVKLPFDHQEEIIEYVLNNATK